MNSINFGTTVIGEVLNRKIQLFNKGALGTKFRLVNKKSLKKEEVKDLTGTEIGSASVLNDIYQLSTTDIANVKSLTNPSKMFTDEFNSSQTQIIINEETTTKDELRNEEISIGSVKDGILDPFSCVDLDFVFAPVFPGKFQEEFVLLFDDKDSKEVRKKN